MDVHIGKSDCGWDINIKDCDKDSKRGDSESEKFIFKRGESIETANFTVGSSVPQTFTLAQVFVDSNKLPRDKVKIEFSTFITISSIQFMESADIRLKFRLKRRSSDGSLSLVRQWGHINSISLIDPVTFNQLLWQMKSIHTFDRDSSLGKEEDIPLLQRETLKISKVSVSKAFMVSHCESLQYLDNWEYFIDVTAIPSIDFKNVMEVAVNLDNDASIEVFT